MAGEKANEEDLTSITRCYCPNCKSSAAKTNMLPTRVPLFREIIIVSLYCEECGFRNVEATFGGEIQEKGHRLDLIVASDADLNRQLVKSDSAIIIIPSLEFEIPATTQRGTVSTIEGMLLTAADSLEALQPERLRLGDVENFHRCHNTIISLRRYAGRLCDHDEADEGASSIYPFQITVDDPAGNSFIENPNAPHRDPQLSHKTYFRTPAQDLALGLQPTRQVTKGEVVDNSNTAHAVDADSDLIGQQETNLSFQTSCPHCQKETTTNMCMVDVPHFKEAIIMSMLCDYCGYRSSELKGGGGIPDLGTNITLKVTQVEDLERQVLKSDTAGIIIPELDLELEEGGLNGVYTTVEGLLLKMRDRLTNANPFGSGDAARNHHVTNDRGESSVLSDRHARFFIFLQKLEDMAHGKLLPFTLVISDPLSNSFVGPVTRDAVPLPIQSKTEGIKTCLKHRVDDAIVVEEFERSDEQNEILGLKDIKTEEDSRKDNA